MNSVKAMLVALVLLVPLGLGLGIAAGLWSECRADHSALYCFRVLGR